MEKNKKIDNKRYISHLKDIIDTSIRPLIDNDYVLWDLPYHTNIGDSLIWQGELDFLATIPHKCIDTQPAFDKSFPTLDTNVVILLHGGGNWGDLYELHQNFRRRVVEHYPNNKIVIFPQTIHYTANVKLSIDTDVYSLHRNVTICTRDNVSFTFAKEHFTSNNILLVPDMAFYIKVERYSLSNRTKIDKTLLLQRADVEKVEISDELLKSLSKFEIHDWPTYEKSFKTVFLFYKLIAINKLLNSKFNFNINWLVNKYARKVFLPKMMSIGTEFINNYTLVYSTRLHVCILSVLMNTQVKFIDNSYGKNSTFYKAWLSELPNLNCEML